MKFTKSQTVLYWSVSYFLILVLFVTSIAVMFGLNVNALNDINDKYCRSLFDAISENGERAVNQSGEIFSALVNYDDLENIMSIDSLEGYFQSKQVSELINEISYCQDENVAFYIYLPKTNSVISHGGIYKAETYYVGFMQQTYSSYEEWLRSHESEYIDMKGSVNEESPGSIIFRKEYEDKNGNSFVLATIFDESYLLAVDNLPGWVHECDIYLSDLKGNIFIYHQKSKINKELSSIESIERVYDDNWGIFTKITPSVIPCGITIVYPKTAAWSEIETMKNIQLGLSLIMIILSLIVIINAIKRNYSPIASMLNVLDIKNSYREYEDIEKRIYDLLMQNKNYMHTVDDVNAQMTLSRCLSKNYSAQHILDVLKEQKINFEKRYFTLCAFELFDINELYGNFDEISKDEKSKDLIFILSNVFGELFAQSKCECRIVTVSEDIFMIINTDECGFYNSGEIHKVIKSGISFIKESFCVKLSYALSELYEGMGHLSDAYSQCMYLLRYKAAMGIEEFITKDDIQKPSAVNLEAVFDMETEQKLINCIAAGKTESAVLILQQLFAAVSEMKLTVEQLQCVLIDIGCILYKVPQCDIDFENILSSSKSCKLMEEFLIKKVQELCANFIPVKITKTNKIHDIVKYIDENFTEGINLDVLAVKFDISSGYLSRSFKQHMSMSVADYITNKRLNYAKELLRETDIPIKEIAVRSGFDSMRTFNRIYQKNEGITPSEYRRSTF